MYDGCNKDKDSVVMSKRDYETQKAQELLEELLKQTKEKNENERKANSSNPYYPSEINQEEDEEGSGFVLAIGSEEELSNEDVNDVREEGTEEDTDKLIFEDAKDTESGEQQRVTPTRTTPSTTTTQQNISETVTQVFSQTDAIATEVPPSVDTRIVFPTRRPTLRPTTAAWKEKYDRLPTRLHGVTRLPVGPTSNYFSKFEGAYDPFAAQATGQEAWTSIEKEEEEKEEKDDDDDDRTEQTEAYKQGIRDFIKYHKKVSEKEREKNGGGEKIPDVSFKDYYSQLGGEESLDNKDVSDEEEDKVKEGDRQLLLELLEKVKAISSTSTSVSSSTTGKQVAFTPPKTTSQKPHSVATIQQESSTKSQGKTTKSPLTATAKLATTPLIKEITASTTKKIVVAFTTEPKASTKQETSSTKGHTATKEPAGTTKKQTKYTTLPKESTVISTKATTKDSTQTIISPTTTNQGTTTSVSTTTTTITPSTTTSTTSTTTTTATTTTTKSTFSEINSDEYHDSYEAAEEKTTTLNLKLTTRRKTNKRQNKPGRTRRQPVKEASTGDGNIATTPISIAGRSTMKETVEKSTTADSSPSAANFLSVWNEGGSNRDTSILLEILRKQLSQTKESNNFKRFGNGTELYQADDADGRNSASIDNSERNYIPGVGEIDKNDVTNDKTENEKQSYSYKKNAGKNKEMYSAESNRHTKEEIKKKKEDSAETRGSYIGTKEDSDETEEVSKETIDDSDETEDDSDETREDSDESKEDSDETKEDSDETKEHSDETKEDSDETKEDSDETKEDSDETKESSDDTKDDSDETKEDSDETKESSDETKESSDETKEDSDETKEHSDEDKEDSDETKEDSDESKEDSNDTKEDLNEARKYADETKEDLDQVKVNSEEAKEDISVPKEDLWDAEEDPSKKSDGANEQEFESIKQDLEELRSRVGAHRQQLQKPHAEEGTYQAAVAASSNQNTPANENEARQMENGSGSSFRFQVYLLAIISTICLITTQPTML